VHLFAFYLVFLSQTARPRRVLDEVALPSRDAATQRRAMQAAMAAAIMAMRTTRARTGGLRPPPGSSS